MSSSKKKRTTLRMERILEIIATYQAYTELQVKDVKGKSVAEAYWHALPEPEKTVLELYIDDKFAKMMQILAPIYTKNKTPEAEA